MKPRSPDRDEDVAAYVDAFRADVDCPVDVDAAWARFEETVHPPRPVASRLWMAAAVLVAALAVAWLTIPEADTAVEQHRAGHQARDEAVAPKTEGRPAPPPVPRPARVVPPSMAEDGASSDGKHEDASGRPRRRPASVDDVGSPGNDGAAAGPSRLEEELRLLEAMRAALAASRHAEALELVRSHAQRFAAGPFAAERELTRVRALCGLGRLDAVREAKARFAMSFPSSHLGTLVRGACEGVSPSPIESVGDSDHDGGGVATRNHP